ncbi:MAG TPA: NUDIX domain-containing protein [Mucilaginibacter sp.]|nr:NUDIX domain-containing protein [Mucilaginibacter sp.]
MDDLQQIQHFFSEGYLDYRPNLTVDCAIFGYHEGQLQLLLVKNKLITKWCLPGGYIKKVENLNEAAARTTLERTGMENLFLKQFKTFGNPGRNDSRGAVDPEKLFELVKVRFEDTWLTGETASVGFYAITDIVNARPMADFLSSECKWFSIDQLPPLAFDHEEMVQEALFTMRMHLYHFPIGKSLLPEKFTLKEIHLFYETMIGKKLNPSNFPNKLISLGLLEKLNEKRSIGAHRSPTFYRFNTEVYDKALEEGLVLA